jgi:hypothetical protein
MLDWPATSSSHQRTARRGREEPRLAPIGPGGGTTGSAPGKQPLTRGDLLQAGYKTRLTRQRGDVPEPNVPAGLGARPLVWRLADAGSANEVSHPSNGLPTTEASGPGRPGRLSLLLSSAPHRRVALVICRRPPSSR